MTGRTPRVSFVIPTRNRGVELAATLDHLSGLGLDANDAEVIVVDNASDKPAMAAPWLVSQRACSHRSLMHQATPQR